MSAHDERRSELIAAAVGDDLTDDERAEFRQLAQSDPTVRTELADLLAVADQAAMLGTWTPTPVDDGLRARVLAAVGDDARSAGARRTRWRMAAGAAACIVVGAVIGVLGTEVDPGPPTGPPGTLGAVEHVVFVNEPAGVVVDGDLVAHTWGTETVLAIDGLPPGDRYTVVLVARDGREFPSGGFFGSAVTIDCRMNAALLREDVADVEIRDGAGATVSAAHAPAVQ